MLLVGTSFMCGGKFLFFLAHQPTTYPTNIFIQDQILDIYAKAKPPFKIPSEVKGDFRDEWKMGGRGSQCLFSGSFFVGGGLRDDW